MGGAIGVGTLHKIERKNPYGRVILSGNYTTLWLHLANWNLEDFQLCSESKMEPSVATYCKINFVIRGLQVSIKVKLLTVLWVSESFSQIPVGYACFAPKIVYMEGGTPHILCWWGDNWGGDTAQQRSFFVRGLQVSIKVKLLTVLWVSESFFSHIPVG